MELKWEGVIEDIVWAYVPVQDSIIASSGCSYCNVVFTTQVRGNY